MIERIKQIADNENISINAFEKKIAASEGVIRRAIKNNTDIQSKWLSKIMNHYPQYSCEWLLTGKGSMLKNEEDTNYEAVLIYLRDHIDELLEDTRFNHFMDLLLAKREVLKKEKDLDHILQDFKDRALNNK